MEATALQPLGIAQRAAELRSRVLPQYSVQPLPIVAVATLLGYKVSEFVPTPTTTEVSGAVRHDQKIIFVNASEGAERKRFTIAHEIGHIVLHGNEGSFVDYRRQMAYGHEDQPREREANQFAAELLMPRAVFEAVWNLCGGSVGGVADMLQVSPAAAEVRARQLRLA